MAKGNKSAERINKVSFGVKKRGCAKKNYGPKQQKPKSYAGQGRA
jgi:hypothetical protein